MAPPDATASWSSRPWQARAFGMATALLERQELGWEALRRHLARAIQATPEATYYEQFVEALAAFPDQIAAPFGVEAQSA